jgi:arylsulfatase A
LNWDGTSSLPALKNKAIERSKPLAWVYYAALNERRVAMRDGDWKVLATLNISTLRSVDSRNAAQVKAARLSDFQMFKITEDIGERHDLCGSQPKKLAELKQRLTTYYRDLIEDSHFWSIKR